jgi:PAS domain S-box-containing protein
MDTGSSPQEIIDMPRENRRTPDCLGHRPGSGKPAVFKMHWAAFGVRLLMILLLFCLSAPVRAQQAGSGGRTPAEGIAPDSAASNDKVSLTPEERQWLSRNNGRIKIGITVIPPQILRDDGAYKGLAIDYIRLMERKLGCRFELVPYATWNEVILAAKERRIDMIFAAQRTPERLVYLLFTKPYLELPNMILVRKDRQGGATLKEMKGWSVAASEGSAVHEYLEKEFGYLDLRPVHDELSGLMKVSMGEVDAMVVEISRASYYIEKAGILNLRVAGNAGLLYQLRFAVRNDWPILCGVLDKGLSAITDQERRDISQRWIIVGERSIFASRAFRISLVAGVGVIALTVVGAIVWNRTLRRIVKQRTSQLQKELTNRGKAEEALHQLNRELRAISSCNQILMRAVDEQSLLTDICRIVCDEAGYRMAWVGYAENDDEKSVRLTAWAGVEEGYLAEARLTWADTERGRGPAGVAIRCARTDCSQDFTTDPRMAPWRENTLQRGYRSCIALPLKDEKATVFGVFLIYSEQPNAFTPDEIRLMEELAGDLSFGITVLRGRNARQEAERGIALLSFALDNVRDAAFLIDEKARFHYVNEESCRVLGYTRDELLGLSVPEVDPDFPLERWSDHWNELKMRRSLTFEGRHRHRNGSTFPVEISSNYVEYDGQCLNLALVRDITERKRAEEEITRNLAINQALSSLYIPIVTAGANIEQIADTILQKSRHLTGSAHGFVAEIDPTTGDQIAHTLSRMMPECEVAEEELRIIRFPRGADGLYNGLWGHALNTREPFYTNAPVEHHASMGIPGGRTPGN